MNLDYSKESNDLFFKQILKNRFNSISNIESFKNDYENFSLNCLPVDNELKEKIINKFDNLSCKSKEFKMRFGNLSFKEAFIKNYYRYTKQPRCCFCGQILEKDINDEGEEYIIADIEHIFPKSLFPQFALHPKNLAPCCKECNQVIKRDKFFKNNYMENFKQVISGLGLNYKKLHPLELWKNVKIIDDNLNISIQANSIIKEFFGFYHLEKRFKSLYHKVYNNLFTIIKNSDIRTPESLERLLENLASSNWYEVNDGYSLNNSPQIWQEFIENILYDECKLMALWDEVKSINSFYIR